MALRGLVPRLRAHRHRPARAAKVIQILSRYLPIDALTSAPPDQLHLQSLGLSSADMINVIVEVEDGFDLDVQDDYLGRLLTLGDLVRAIDETPKLPKPSKVGPKVGPKVDR